MREREPNANPDSDFSYCDCPTTTSVLWLPWPGPI